MQTVNLFIVLLTEDVKVSFVWVIAITAIFRHTFVTKRLFIVTCGICVKGMPTQLFQVVLGTTVPQS